MRALALGAATDVDLTYTHPNGTTVQQMCAV
jgi:hypothetical protein